MLALTFTLELKEPLLMTAIEGDPNSAVSLPFVPGSALRGALAGRYRAAKDVVDLAADEPAAILTPIRWMSWASVPCPRLKLGRSAKALKGIRFMI